MFNLTKLSIFMFPLVSVPVDTYGLHVHLQKLAVYLHISMIYVYIYSY